MSADQNRQFRLAARPQGLPERSDWELVSEAVPSPGDGEVLVGIEYISLDPAMRGWMNAGRSYIKPVEIGEVMRAGAAGHVLASKHPDFAEGDAVTGNLGVQTHAAVAAQELRKVDTSLAGLPAYLGVLGMPGMTAYFGLFDVGAMQQDDTVVVSGAAGAVGALVGQMAKLRGARAVGIAGGPDKCRYVTDELGFDACIDYKNADVYAGLHEHCPKGINVYFDNVGGEILDAALACLALNARVAICGAISQYNNMDDVRGPKNYMSLLINRARMQGFVVFDFAERYGEAVQAMAGWLAEGKLEHKEDIVPGFETFPDTLLKLFSGENFGKLVLQVED